MAGIKRLGGSVASAWANPFRRSASHISQLYKQVQVMLPFTEHECNMINNALIHMYHENQWNRALYAKGMPAFLLASPDFREKFIRHSDSDATVREELRRCILNATTDIHSPRKGDTSKANPFSIVYEALSSSMVNFVQQEMPQTMLVFHGAMHLADLTLPQGATPTRRFKRHIVAHLGPPNSGKTYEAHCRLLQSQSGIYCSPLRLLAWEMCRKLTDQKVKCALLTGQENRTSEADTHLSCTVEMTPMERHYDCAVIDEMQMIGDRNRGYAWTRAFLEVKAPEVHICGSSSCYTIAKYMANICGDTLEIREHEKLGSLTVLDDPVSIHNLQPGDCVVCFSRETALSLLENIEKVYFENSGGRPTSTAIVYGSLPPETRTQQIEAFNSREKAILVASDVIGMGVNVRIKRLLFHRVMKFDGNIKRLLTAAEVQQIAGRAGRYSMDCGDGYVGCLRKEDIGYIKRMMKQPQEQIEHAVVAPTQQIIAAFADAVRSATNPPANLAQAIQIYRSMARTAGAFELYDVNAMVNLAKSFENINLQNDVLVEYLFVPLGTQPALQLILRTFALSHALFNNVKLKNVLHQDAVAVIDSTDTLRYANDRDGLRRMELLYQILDAYVWLWHKFPNVYVDYHAVLNIKGRIAKDLQEMLDGHVFTHDGERDWEQHEETTMDANITKQLIRTEHC